MIDIYDDPTPVRHGYTVANIARIAHTTVRSAARRGAHDLDELRATAMCALIGELAAHDCDPGLSVLMRAAEYAIAHAHYDDWSNRGFNPNTRELQKGFPRYWRPGAGTPADEAVAERVAVGQILGALTERQRETVAALAASDGDPKVAALILRITPNSVACNLRNVRRAFLALWFEHETPRAVNWRKGRTLVYSEQAAAARPEIARRAVRIREERRRTAQVSDAA